MGLLTLLNCYILLYILLKLQRGAPYIFNVVWGSVFYSRSLTLAYVGQTHWPQPGETVSEHRLTASVCQAWRLRPEKTSEVKIPILIFVKKSF